MFTYMDLDKLDMNLDEENYRKLIVMLLWFTW